MSFAGGFSFGASNNNNTTGSNAFGSSTGNAFGGGSNTTSGGGFGTNTSTSGSNLFGSQPSAFGSSSTGGSGLFGAPTTNNTTPAFGSSTGGFGANNNTTSAFGGNTTTTGGFGGFGANNNTTTNNSPFGSTTQPKPLFGQGGTGTTGAFGTTNNSPFSGSGTALGGAVPPSDGTGSVPFQPTVDKESGGQTSNYQSISFMQPYSRYSFEELRMGDYQNGRQFANQGGTAGAFGQSNFSSTFGGTSNTGNAFGQTSNTAGGGLFGTNTASTGTGFGSTTATTGGFGGTGGGLFGSNNQNKPAGSLFGAQTSASTSGGLFGTSNNTTNTTNTGSGFGFGTQNNNNNTTTGGGLFGNNNQTQNKPAGGLFGASNTNTNAGGGFSFGQNNNNQTNAAPSGGLFGNTSNTMGGGGLFGNTATTSNNNTLGSGLFGTNNTGTQNSGSIFGNKTGTGSFGTTTNNQSGGGLFGNTNNNTAGGGLFGQNNNQQQNPPGGGLFGTNNQQSNTGGGLFGNTQQNKPGGLFGNTQSNTGGGLFGSNNQQQSSVSGGLFGQSNNNAASGSLFGNNNNNNAGNSLFGNNQNNQQKPGGLFGASNNNQPGGLFGNSQNSGLFNASQTNQQQQTPNQQEVKHASLLDPNPYGQSSIWTGLPAPTADNSKPLFTPLIATQQLKESAMKPLPSLRLNQSRYNTPPRRNGGYGFSYSTYGTPNSAASTPGGASFSGSLYGSRGYSGGSFGRSFNRSTSVQNLRAQYGSDADDIWKNPFTPSHRNSSGSIKRLTIDRSIRQDLFNRPPPQPQLPAPRAATNGESSNAPQQAITDGTADTGRKLSKRVSFENDTAMNGTSGALARIENDSDSEGSPPIRPASASSANLQPVPEDRESHQISSAPTKANAKPDPEPGNYWMRPSRSEMQKIPKDQLKSFKGFQVGRDACGFVTFDGAVDLTAVNIDDIFEKIVEIRIRSITVYPDSATKPPAGRGLNVPSTISIENSWPRSKGKVVGETSGPIFERHINRLRRMEGTEFINYDAATGTWLFKVPHYTRYGLDYDDDEIDQSELSLPPTSLGKSADASVMEVDDHDSYDEDDTFAFKKSGKSVPGQFGRDSMIEVEEESDMQSDDAQGPSDDGSEHSAYSEEDDMMSEEEQSPPIPGSLPPQPAFFSPAKSPSKLKAPGTPGKPLLDLEGDWAEQLQRTISPRKQNRDVLREAQNKVLLDNAFSPIKPKAQPQVNFRNSIDIMNSIFKPASSKNANKAAEPDFEFPYSKRSKTFHPNDEEMSEADARWHASFKPSFTNDGKIVYKSRKAQAQKDWKAISVAADAKGVVVVGQERSDLKFDLDAALASSEVELTNGVPAVRHKPVSFSQLASQATGSVAELYEFAHVLFDDYEDQFTRGLNATLQGRFAHRVRKDRLAQFLTNRILASLEKDLAARAQTNPIQAAVLCLTAHDVPGAVELLRKDKDYRLALLVAQLDGADRAFMDDVKHQLDAWREQKALSEFDLDIRALYEICAGNVTVSQGKIGSRVPVEDRAETFTLSERYGLSWLQCFALGLFYGREEKMNGEGISKIEDAVREYQKRIDDGLESTKPPENDVMWSLLKYYAHTKILGSEVPSFPAALTGLAKPFDHSKLFTFHHAITANLKVSTDAATCDTLSEALASELSSHDDIASAIYALIHLSSPTTRRSTVQSLLDAFAASLPGPDVATSDAGIQLWQRLTMDLKIPTAWLYMAKARYAASTTNNGGDSISELRYLVAAEAWEEAGECLVKKVAPSFVVDEDYDGLLEMCGLFGDDPASKVAGWHEGGDVLALFGQLLTGMIARTDGHVIGSLRKRLVNMSHRTSRGDSKVSLGKMSKYELEEHVAIKEMSNTLARLSEEGYEVGSTKEILDLPVTADVRARLQMLFGANDNTRDAQPATTAPGPATTARGRGRPKKSASTQGLGVPTRAIPNEEDEEMQEGDESGA